MCVQEGKCGVLISWVAAAENGTKLLVKSENREEVGKSEIRLLYHKIQPTSLYIEVK